ncbi:MAG: glutamate racemase [Phycisphaerae bacterium]|nr:glutamate racemase [Phycisphaerae bacterium]
MPAFSIQPSAPIAVFDSGLGGLTVVRALQRRLPREKLIYFGDTARVPYGSKSPRTVLQFARQCLHFLTQFKPKLMVVACNTVSATALQSLHQDFVIPIIGVLEPGAVAAVAASARIPAGQGRRIGLIATEATIASQAYNQAVSRLDPTIQVLGRACPLLVPMIEEGRLPESPVVRSVLQEYLQPFKSLQVPVLILGCTHYPIFSQAIEQTLGVPTTLIDSADQTALVVAEKLATMHWANDVGDNLADGLTCYVTDQGQRFESLAGRFLGRSITQPVWVEPERLENPTVEK